jgi:predicted DCC family thiol-disulfide oxidoreductase YuxK
MFKNGEAPMEKLTVLYDASCGFCVSCRRWLEAQPTYFPVEFVPARSAAARRLFPELSAGESADELVAVDDQGAVYRDAHAWIVCLYALREYREWAQRLSSPALLPFARQAFELLSKNRRELSAKLKLLPEAQLAQELAQTPAPACERNVAELNLLPADRGRAWRGALLAALLTILALVVIQRAPRISVYFDEQGQPALAGALRFLEPRRPSVSVPVEKPQTGRESQKEAPVEYILWTYAIYLAISIALTVWVARTLHKNGRIFLVDTFAGNEAIADSVNHLLVVGFYLINIGYVALALKETHKPTDAPASLEMLSSKVGLVLLVLGGMHFFNLYVFSRLRRRALLRHMPPPVRPQSALTPPPVPPRPPARPSLDAAAAGVKA